MDILRVEDTIAGSYESASWTVVLAQIQSRIKARRCAAKLELLELKNFFLETFAVVRSSFFLSDLKK